MNSAERIEIGDKFILENGVTKDFAGNEIVLEKPTTPPKEVEPVETPRVPAAGPEE